MIDRSTSAESGRGLVDGLQIVGAARVDVGEEQQELLHRLV